MLFKNNKLKTSFFIRSNLIEIYYCISSIFLILIVSVPPFRSLSSISASLKGYYYVNYFELGFIKRGLIGSIYKIFNLQVCRPMLDFRKDEIYRLSDKYQIPYFLLLFLCFYFFVFWYGCQTDR